MPLRYQGTKQDPIFLFIFVRWCLGGESAADRFSIKNGAESRLKTYLDCIPCFFRQALAAARMASTDETIHRRVLNSVALMIPDLALNATPPEIAQQVYQVVYEITGNNDPYHEAKNRANESAMSCYSRMKDTVDYSNEPLQAACKLAIAGNDIDLGAQVDYGSIDSIIEGSLGFELDQGNYTQFKKSIKKASLILYIGDNAGETVFDRLLINAIGRPVTYAVRENPIINDATEEDAIASGLDEVSEIVSSGCDAPDTLLRQCSESFLDYFQAADIIISKGQGNYETLSNEKRPIFYLLKAKCPVVARDLRVKEGAIVVKYSLSKDVL